MEWIQQFTTSLKKGHRAFVFTGRVDELFPSQSVDEQAPFDEMIAWTELLTRVTRAAYGSEALIFSYDVAQGLTFLEEGQEAQFLAFLAPPKRTRNPDPLMQAREALQSASLPRSPAEAFDMIQRVLTAATAVKRKCVVLFPYTDGFCTSTPALGATPSPEALRLFQWLQSSVYRRAGHLFLLSIPTLARLPDRFRQASSLFLWIDVRNPTFAERAAWIRQLCEMQGSVEAELQELKAREAQILQRHRECVEKEICELEITRKEIAADSDSWKEHPDYQNAVENWNQAKRNLEGVRESLRTASAKQFRECMTAMERVSSALQDPMLQTVVLTEDTVEKLQEGDLVHITDAGVPEGCTKTVLKRLKDKGFHLSRTDDSRTPHATGSNQIPVIFRMRVGAIWQEMGAQSIKWATGPVTRVPKKRELLEIELRTLERMRNELESETMTDPRVRAAHTAVEEAEQNTDRVRARLQREQEGRLKEVEDSIQRANAQLQNPTDPEFPNIRAEIVRLERCKARQEHPSQRRFDPPHEGVEQTAHQTQGLSYADIHLLFGEAESESCALQKSDIAARRQVLLEQNYGHLFEIVLPSYGFEGIAGLVEVKEFFRTVSAHMKARDLRRVPMGCLLMGPPGTGKTAIAEAFARECGFLFVKMKNVRRMWVGASEQELEDAHRAIREMAPVIVLRDEVDEEDSGRDTYQGDTGVSARLRRSWMTFLSDPTIRGRVFVVSCTNRPDRLDSALKRCGRTDERIPIPMPDVETRDELFRVMIRRSDYPSTVRTFEAFAKETEGWSGAEIEVVVRRAFDFALQRGKDAIDDRAIREAVTDFIPSSSPEETRRMEFLAIRACSSKRFIPARYRESTSLLDSN